MLDTKVVDQLIKEAGRRIRVSGSRSISSSRRSRRPDRQEFQFDIDPFRKHCLLNGLDEIGLTLERADKIKAFEQKRRGEQPWLFT